MMVRLARRALFGLSVTLVASVAAAQQPGPPPLDTNAITPAMVDMGRAIFHGKGTCFMCHGPQLEGSQIAPTLKAHAWRDAKNGQFDEIFRVATHGVPSTVMVAFPGGISKSEAMSVASYIWSVNNRKVKP
jgi:mono/diheme cytochrome c family protein